MTYLGSQVVLVFEGGMGVERGETLYNFKDPFHPVGVSWTHGDMGGQDSPGLRSLYDKPLTKDLKRFKSFISL